MPTPATRDILLCILACVSAALPWWFLRRYESRTGDPAYEKRFKPFQFFEMAWHIFLSVLGLLLLLVSFGRSINWLAILALAVCLLTLPEALLAGFTGIYRKDRHRGYVDYYETHKDPARQFWASTKIPVLQVVGWIQTGLLGVLMLLSIWVM